MVFPPSPGLPTNLAVDEASGRDADDGEPEECRQQGLGLGVKGRRRGCSRAPSREGAASVPVACEKRAQAVVGGEDGSGASRWGVQDAACAHGWVRGALELGAVAEIWGLERG